MADPITLKRLARRLEQTASATPLGEGYWPALATAAATVLERPPQVVNAALPAQPFVALARSQDGFGVVARGGTLVELVDPVTAYLTERGSGTADVLLCEVRRVLTVS